MIYNLLSLDFFQSLPCQLHLSHTGFLPGPEKAKQSPRISCICSSLYLEKHTLPTSQDHLPQFSLISSQICLYVNFSDHPLLNNTPSKSFPLLLPALFSSWNLPHNLSLMEVTPHVHINCDSLLQTSPFFEDCAFQKTSKFACYYSMRQCTR